MNRNTVTPSGKELGAYRAEEGFTRRALQLEGAGSAIRSVLPFATVLVIWWAAWAILDPPEIILVSPASVFSSFLESVGDGQISTFITRSLGRLGVGTLFATLVGVPLGWALGLNEDVAVASEPVLRFFNAVSGIAWLPAMIIWLGFTEQTIQAIIIYTMIFPVMFNAMTGVRTIPGRFTDACRTLGAGRLRILRDVYIPGSFPSVMTGLRLGIGFGWRALIAGEFVVGTAAGGGIGFYIFDARVQGVIGKVMAGMIILGVLWLIMDRLVLRPIEEYTSNRWGMVRT